MAPYDLEKMLVVGVASSALFDLSDADTVFREHGEARYREYQEAHIADSLEPGVAFPFIKRLLSLNDLSQDGMPLVEVIVLSRNDPETGLRVMRSVAHHNLPISRAIFMQGRSPYEYMGGSQHVVVPVAERPGCSCRIDDGVCRRPGAWVSRS